MLLFGAQLYFVSPFVLLVSWCAKDDLGGGWGLKLQSKPRLSLEDVTISPYQRTRTDVQLIMSILCIC